MNTESTNGADAAADTNDVQSGAEEAEIETTETESEDDEGSEPDKQQQRSKSGDDDTPFPKKAVNAISRRDRRIGQLNAQLRQANVELAQFRQHQQQTQQRGDDGEPSEDDFETYGEYLKAVAKHAAQKESGQHRAADQEAVLQHRQLQAYHAWRQERGNDIDADGEALAKELPEFRQMMEENLDIVQALPPQIQQLFLQLESRDANLAFLALAQEGKLETLLHMPPQLAAVAIGRAADRGAAMLASKKTSKAPNPMAPNRGRGSGIKSEDSMSGAELLRKHGVY